MAGELSSYVTITHVIITCHMPHHYMSYVSITCQYLVTCHTSLLRFVLLESRDLSRGQVKQVEALGQNLAVFRGSETGTVFVTEAYCPHLGANIAAGGR